MSEREIILVADDNESVTTALSLLLERPGRTTIVCSDIESAEIILGRVPVTHLVTDVQFSGEFGFEGLHYLDRVRARLPHGRIVLITGHPSEALRAAAIKHGAHALLGKPFEIAELEAALGTPHPPFGHLLPASGEKGNGEWAGSATTSLQVVRRATSSLPLAPLAGRGWREAPGEGSSDYEIIHVDSLDELLDKLDVAFQPIVHVPSSDTIFAFEALTRIRGGWAGGGPAELFHYAERLGRLRELNLKTLSNALESATTLPESAALFINLDPTAFGPDLPQFVERAAARGGVALDRIVLEVTERSNFENEHAVVPLFRELREKGIRFALDDHGSSYSHLSLIDQVRPSFIKISNTFGTNLEEDDTHRLIVAHMRSFARDFGCRTVLEGIESEGTADVAAYFGVELAQGYHFGRPQFAAHWSREEVHS